MVRVHDERGSALEALVIACKRDHQDYLFPDEADTPLIAWHRARDFQLASLAAIAEQLLRASWGSESGRRKRSALTRA